MNQGPPDSYSIVLSRFSHCVQVSSRKGRGVRAKVTCPLRVTPFIRTITFQKPHTVDSSLHHTVRKWRTRSPLTPGECEEMDGFNWEHSHSKKKKKRDFVHEKKRAEWILGRHRTFLSYFQLDKSWKELLIGSVGPPTHPCGQNSGLSRFAAPARAAGRSVGDSKHKGQGEHLPGQGAQQGEP